MISLHFRFFLSVRVTTSGDEINAISVSSRGHKSNHFPIGLMVSTLLVRHPAIVSGFLYDENHKNFFVDAVDAGNFSPFWAKAFWTIQIW